jgi:hypothetical protein
MEWLFFYEKLTAWLGVRGTECTICFVLTLLYIIQSNYIGFLRSYFVMRTKLYVITLKQGLKTSKEGPICK